MDPIRIIRRKEVIRLTGLSTVTIWRMERRGEFPGRVKLTQKLVGWYLHEIEEWIKSRDRF